MQKVITINLNGNAYQLDERGYDSLLVYLRCAEDALADDPDRAEILADIEQAIAEKCQRYLGPQKSVVMTDEVDQIIKEMGPVEGAARAAAKPSSDEAGRASSGASGQTGRGANTHRRLYLIHEGQMLAGVCNGVAAYLNVDVTIIRIVFVGLALLTKGFWILAYFILAFVIPSANTSEERAAAQGLPFNAQELIDQAKRNYSEFTQKHWNWDWHWRADKDWKRWRHEQRKQRRAWRRQMRHSWKSPSYAGYTPAAAPPPLAAGYGSRVAAGFLVPVLSLLGAAALFILLYSVASLLTTHELFGQALPDDVPLWVALLVILVIYNAVVWPLHAARRASYYAVAGFHSGAIAAWDGLMSFGFAIVIIWLSYHYVPEVQHVIDELPEVLKSLVDVRM
jgi:phage shock protein PspC (stress-responsive transcriptional regulator)